MQTSGSEGKTRRPGACVVCVKLCAQRRFKHAPISTICTVVLPVYFPFLSCIFNCRCCSRTHRTKATVSATPSRSSANRAKWVPTTSLTHDPITPCPLQVARLTLPRVMQAQILVHKARRASLIKVCDSEGRRRTITIRKRKVGI